MGKHIADARLAIRDPPRPPSQLFPEALSGYKTCRTSCCECFCLCLFTWPCIVAVYSAPSASYLGLSCTLLCVSVLHSLRWTCQSLHFALGTSPVATIWELTCGEHRASLWFVLAGSFDCLAPGPCPLPTKRCLVHGVWFQPGARTHYDII